MIQAGDWRPCVGVKEREGRRCWRKGGGKVHRHLSCWVGNLVFVHLAVVLVTDNKKHPGLYRPIKAVGFPHMTSKKETALYNEEENSEDT